MAIKYKTPLFLWFFQSNNVWSFELKQAPHLLLTNFDGVNWGGRSNLPLQTITGVYMLLEYPQIVSRILYQSDLVSDDMKRDSMNHSISWLGRVSEAMGSTGEWG